MLLGESRKYINEQEAKEKPARRKSLEQRPVDPGLILFWVLVIIATAIFATLWTWPVLAQ